MVMAAILKSLDNLDESLHEHYTEKDGRFILDVQPVEGFALEDVTNLKKTVKKEREDRQEAQRLLKSYDGLDAEEAAKAIAKLAELGDLNDLDLDKKVKDQVAAHEHQLQTKFDAEKKKYTEKTMAELEALRNEQSLMTTQLKEQMVRAEGARAIAAHKGSAALLLPVVESRARMVKDPETGRYKTQILDANGEPRMTMKSGSHDEMGIEEFVGEVLKVDENYARAFDGTSSSGGGASGSDAGGGGGTGPYRITQEEARDQQKYRAAKDAATKAGRDLVIAG